MSIQNNDKKDESKHLKVMKNSLQRTNFDKVKSIKGMVSPKKPTRDDD